MISSLFGVSRGGHMSFIENWSEQCAKMEFGIHFPRTELALRGSGGINGLVEGCGQREAPQTRKINKKPSVFKLFQKKCDRIFSFIFHVSL